MIRIFLQNRIWLIDFQVMSSFVHVVISQNELKLLDSVEKWITLKKALRNMNQIYCIFDE